MARNSALGAFSSLALLLAAGSCAPRGSSFETLGVPAAREFTDRGAIVIGWAREERGGWRVEELQVDEEARREWRVVSQSPAVIHLAPGDHRLSLTAIRRGDEAARRYKVRPVSFPLRAEEVRLCVVSLSRRDRPSVSCPHYLGPRSRRQPRASSKAADQPPEGGLAAVLERLDRIERQLAKLTEGSDEEGGQPSVAKATSPEGRRPGSGLELDREFPVGEGPAKTPPSDRAPPQGLKKINIPENEW